MKKFPLSLLTGVLLFITYLFLFPKFILPVHGADWPMFRMDSNHSGYNSDELILKPPLQLKWNSREIYGQDGHPLRLFQTESPTLNCMTLSMP